MAKQAAKKPVAKPKTAAKSKPVAKAKPAAKPKVAKAKPAPKPKPAPTDWAAILRSGEAGVTKWNNLTTGARFKISLVGADLTGADLTLAKFAHFDLSGADLTGALLNNMSLHYAEFDEKTKWPAGFTPGDSLKWKGEGTDPRKAAAPAAAASAPAALPKPADFSGFMTQLKQVTDPAKLTKATKMLKAEKFRLYAKVAPDHLVGVVKSQGDPNLVYSCRLGSDGKYACCTQNLNICGGLHGSPCKHLLVLIVGLSRAGELDAATAHEWTQNARGKKAELDKDAMTATFLQYKGAEAGEIDWRPTETVPEDFYAM